MALAKASELISLLDQTSTKYRILEAIVERGEGISTKEISEKLSIPEKTIRNNLSFLLQNELIQRPARDVYTTVPGIYTMIKLCSALMEQMNRNFGK